MTWFLAVVNVLFSPVLLWSFNRLIILAVEAFLHLHFITVIINIFHGQVDLLLVIHIALIVLTEGWLIVIAPESLPVLALPEFIGILVRQLLVIRLLNQ